MGIHEIEIVSGYDEQKSSAFKDFNNEAFNWTCGEAYFVSVTNTEPCTVERKLHRTVAFIIL